VSIGTRSRAIGAHAAAALASVVDRALIAIVASRAICLWRIAAGSSRWITGPGIVALVRCDARYWVETGALAAQTNVKPRACITIIAGRFPGEAVAEYVTNARPIEAVVVISAGIVIVTR